MKRSPTATASSAFCLLPSRASSRASAIDGAHKGVGGGGAAFAVENGVVQPGERAVDLVARGKCDGTFMVGLEDLEPLGAFHGVDAGAIASFGLPSPDFCPGPSAGRIHQPVEIVRAVIVQDFLRMAVFALADRFDCAGDRGDALDGTGSDFSSSAIFTPSSKSPFIKLRDHQALLDFDIVGLEFKRRPVELGRCIEVVIDIGGPGGEERARRSC